MHVITTGAALRVQTVNLSTYFPDVCLSPQCKTTSIKVWHFNKFMFFRDARVLSFLSIFNENKNILRGNRKLCFLLTPLPHSNGHNSISSDANAVQYTHTIYMYSVHICSRIQSKSHGWPGQGRIKVKSSPDIFPLCCVEKIAVWSTILQD